MLSSNTTAPTENVMIMPTEAPGPNSNATSIVKITPVAMNEAENTVVIPSVKGIRIASVASSSRFLLMKHFNVKL